MAISPDEVDRRIGRFVDACRRERLKVTHQRTEVFREVARTDAHPDAETVLKRVRRRIPAISLDTVYRTLKLLVDRGLIRKVDLAGERARFDANVGTHHHFVCRECGLIRDFTSDALDALPPPRQARRWGRIESVQVQMRGLCSGCAARRARTRRKT